MEVSDDSSRCKRLLPTTISSPDQSPQTRKGHKASRESSASKKSLKFGKLPPPELTTDNMITSNTLEEFQEITPSEIAFSHMNVEELLESSATEVKVVIVNPNNKVETFSTLDNETKSMIANLCRKRWKTAANLAFAIPDVRKELSDPLRRTIAREFQEYCNNTTDSVLKKSRPDDLASFSNKLLVHEAGVWCPLWMSCVKGTCNVRKSSESELDIRKTNLVALKTSIAARARNPAMSAVAYRISAVLFHSGVNHEDLRMLNKLGVCMSPDMIVKFQRNMGENCAAKVGQWKKEQS